jgi:hypothetical protein
MPNALVATTRRTEPSRNASSMLRRLSVSPADTACSYTETEQRTVDLGEPPRRVYTIVVPSGHELADTRKPRDITPHAFDRKMEIVRRFAGHPRSGRSSIMRIPREQRAGAAGERDVSGLPAARGTAPDLPVHRTKLIIPLDDAMRFVDSQQAHAPARTRQTPDERLQPLRRAVQHRELPGDGGVQCRPALRGVEGRADIGRRDTAAP